MKSFKTKAGTEIPLLDLRGKDYLVVAQRVRWFREEHPTWTIKTAVTYDLKEKWSLGHAIIIDDQGREIANAHKFEDIRGFGDFIEKSETGAVGRALALAGYGTQFAPEFDEDERLADAPVDRPVPSATKAQVHKEGGVLEPWTPDQKKEYCIRKWKISDGRDLSVSQKATLLSVCTSTTFDQAIAGL